MNTEIRNKLSKLDSSELKELKSYVLFLESKKVNIDINGSLQDLYEIVSMILLQETKIKVTPFHIFIKRKGYNAFATFAVELDKFINVNFENIKSITKVQRLHVYKILVRMLINDINRTDTVPTTPSVLFSWGVNLGGVFDRAFPGYLESGLAKLILLAKNKR